VGGGGGAVCMVSVCGVCVCLLCVCVDRISSCTGIRTIGTTSRLPRLVLKLTLAIVSFFIYSLRRGEFEVMKRLQSQMSAELQTKMQARRQGIAGSGAH